MEIQEEIASIKAELAELRPRLNKVQGQGIRLAIMYLNLQKKADEIKQRIVDDEDPAELQLVRTYTHLRRRLVELKRQLHKQSPPWYTACHQVSLHNPNKMLEVMSEEDRLRLLDALQMK